MCRHKVELVLQSGALNGSAGSEQSPKSQHLLIGSCAALTEGVCRDAIVGYVVGELQA